MTREELVKRLRDMANYSAGGKCALCPHEGPYPDCVECYAEIQNRAADAIERLAAYEDTGLEPEVCAAYRKFEDEAISKKVTFNRIIELMNAETEGRLIVLPCKVGTAVYRLTYNQHDGYLLEPSFFKITDINSFGKTVFLTREKAEKALKETEGEE